RGGRLEPAADFLVLRSAPTPQLSTPPPPPLSSVFTATAPSHHRAVACRRPKTAAMVTCTRNKVATLKRVERGGFLVLDEQVKWKVKKSRGQRIKRKQKQ
ncbi:hypothetical protein LINPERPRIM_LOCUS20925, partial [Linum perenne]